MREHSRWSSWTSIFAALGSVLFVAGVARGGIGRSSEAAATPVVVFADELGAGGHRISGDGLGPYVDDTDGSGDGVEAYLGGGGGGDIFLRLAGAPGRGLWLDFGDCLPDPSSCSPPFAAGVDLASSVAVAPTGRLQ